MEIFTSSTGEGIALRFKSFAILAVPYILNYIQFKSGYTFASQSVISWVDSLFVVLFGIIHAYAWFRSIKTPTKQ